MPRSTPGQAVTRLALPSAAQAGRSGFVVERRPDPWRPTPWSSPAARSDGQGPGARSDPARRHPIGPHRRRATGRAATRAGSWSSARDRPGCRSPMNSSGPADPVWVSVGRRGWVPRNVYGRDQMYWRLENGDFQSVVAGPDATTAVYPFTALSRWGNDDFNVHGPPRRRPTARSPRGHRRLAGPGCPRPARQAQGRRRLCPHVHRPRPRFARGRGEEVPEPTLESHWRDGECQRSSGARSGSSQGSAWWSGTTGFPAYRLDSFIFFFFFFFFFFKKKKKKKKKKNDRRGPERGGERRSRLAEASQSTACTSWGSIGCTMRRPARSSVVAGWPNTLPIGSRGAAPEAGWTIMQAFDAPDTTKPTATSSRI